MNLTDQMKSCGDKIPWTPLHYAAASGNQPVIDELIRLGADVTIVDASGRTAQEISYFLNTDVNIDNRKEEFEKIKKLEDEKKMKEKFSIFVQNPLQYFYQSKFTLTENSKKFQLFKQFYNAYKGDEMECEVLDNIIRQKIEGIEITKEWKSSTDFAKLLPDLEESFQSLDDYFSREDDLNDTMRLFVEIKILKRTLRNTMDEMQSLKETVEELKKLCLDKTSESQ
jgi:hypothetical protein